MDTHEELAKKEIAVEIAQLMSWKMLTEAEAAKIIGWEEKKITKLLRGELDDFSWEDLHFFLRALAAPPNATAF